MLTPPQGTPVTINEPALVILCPYRKRSAFSFARRFPSLGRIGSIIDRLTGISFRSFVAENCNYAANPKSPKYQIGLLRDLVESFDVKRPEIVVAGESEHRSQFDELSAMGEVTFCDACSIPEATLKSPQSVVLVYQDALGLGWAGLEAKIRAVAQGELVFVNGRRRIMVLDSRARRRLRWRRAMARTRVGELLLSVIVVPVSLVWAGLDGLRGKS